MSGCRFCDAPLSIVAADLGMSPLANSYLRADQLGAMEPYYPLTAYVCEHCLLMQLPAHETADNIFSDYAYFSSYSTSWLAHSKAYVDKAITELGLGEQSRVVEIASNDGYLLQYFLDAGVPALGVEPAENVAEVARARGIETVVEFFGEKAARVLRDERGPADLVIANNVLAHVPDLNDFVAGIAALLAPGGTATLEFPHLLQLLELRQFDTIYHEHFSYFSVLTLRTVFARHGLRLRDVEELPTHGGSLRLWVVPEAAGPASSSRVEELVSRERAAGLDDVGRFVRFAEEVRREKRAILAFFIEAKERGDVIAGYGAPAKGNTLLNYCGIGTDFVDFTVDLNPHKQGLYLPGTRIPILAPSALSERRPDLVFILPWNLREEIEAQNTAVREWGGRFVARSPELRVS